MHECSRDREYGDQAMEIEKWRIVLWMVRVRPSARSGAEAAAQGKADASLGKVAFFIRGQGCSSIRDVCIDSVIGGYSWGQPYLVLMMCKKTCL